MNNEYNLQRFVEAQNAVYDDAIAILRRGMMCSPYMDFIFPRLRTSTADPATERFAVGSIDEASAYLALPVLGGRYRECLRALQHLPGLSANTVFGDIDARKLHASMTLFCEAGDEFLLETVLEAWFDSLLEPNTMKGLGRTY